MFGKRPPFSFLLEKRALVALFTVIASARSVSAPASDGIVKERPLPLPFPLQLELRLFLMTWPFRESLGPAGGLLLRAGAVDDAGDVTVERPQGRLRRG